MAASDISTFIDSITKALWPALAIIALLVLIRPIRKLLESIRSRSFKIKFGDTEIEVGDLAKQQNDIISDLQQKVALLLRGAPAASSPLAIAGEKQKSVLWVDDAPINNVSLSNMLSTAGFAIDQALSTDDGLRLFSNREYNYVISDMGRTEGRGYNQHAGLDLIKQIRAQNRNVPIIVYTTWRSARNYQKELSDLGVKATGSATDVIQSLIGN